MFVKHKIMTAFYNRTTEKKRLRRALSRERRQLIVVYGRRRCGKSTLLRQFSGDQHSYFLASQSDAAFQRQQLLDLLSTRFPALNDAAFRDWGTLLKALNELTQARFTLIVDEFPYLARSAPELPSLIQQLIDDRDALRFDIILCGSSQQMMRGLALEATAPLYGRADEIVKIEPLAAGWLNHHLPDETPAQRINEYAVWGGVPRYWELRSDYDSFEEAIKTLLLSPSGTLHEEPNRLLLDDMRDTVHSASLLALIAGGVNKVSEIGARLGKPATSLMRPLAKLIELGYVYREVPYGAKAKNRKGNLYRIADPFMRFHYLFVFSNLSKLHPGQLDVVWARFSLRMPGFVAEEWERLCQQAVGLSAPYRTEFYPPARWWGKGKDGKEMEIDLLSTSFEGDKILIGECKWSDVKNPARLLKGVLEKARNLPFFNGQEIIPVLTARRFVHAPDCDGFTPLRVLKALEI